MNDESIVEPPRRGWLSRMLAPEADARPTTAAFVVAVLAAAAFVASVVMTWQSAVIPRDFNERFAESAERESQPLTYVNTVTSPDMLGLVYILGMVVLLTGAGAVVNRADLALRLRFVAGGLAVGLLGVVLALTTAVPNVLYSEFGRFGIPPNLDLMVSYEPGLLCAYAAVVLPIVAIWLAARPAARAAAGRVTAPEAAAANAEHRADPVAPAPAWAIPKAEPLDLTVTPER